MAKLETNDFSTPDDVRRPDPTVTVEVVKIGGGEVGRYTFQPGWRWSECLKPVAGTDSCQAHHIGFIASGRLHVTHDDGTEAEVGPSDAYVVMPGHDAWVVGDEPVVAYEFNPRAAERYAVTT